MEILSTVAPAKIYTKMDCPDVTGVIILLHIRTINKQIKLYTAKAGVRGKRISSHTFMKTFGREVWR